MFHVEHDGEAVGLFVADHYARETKRGGAWMNSFVVQSRLLGTRPVVVNTLNLAKPADGPTLLTVGGAALTSRLARRRLRPWSSRRPIPAPRTCFLQSWTV